MRRTACALAGLALAAAAPPATAAEPVASRTTCGFGTVHRADNGRWAGEIRGGPVLIAGAAGPRSGRLVCSLQLGAPTHAGLDVVTVSSLTTYGAVALPPAPVEYAAGEDDPVAVCTHVEIDGEGTYYWDHPAGAWSTDQGVPCEGTTTLRLPPDVQPVTLLLDLVEEVVDPALCAALGSAAPGVPPVTIDPSGDVHVAGETRWDCPPYA